MNNIQAVEASNKCEGCLGSFSAKKCQELRDIAINDKLTLCTRSDVIYVKVESYDKT